ncbi:hypothetical protein MP638_000187, partial [Amoeboaphelidium occidentale]
MLARTIIWLLQIVIVSKIAVTLEHEKSFLLIDGPSEVYVIGRFRNSILLQANSDIVQRDIETGEIIRTFRAHTKLVEAFVILDDDRMISSGEDNMIIVWDLVSGSVLKKIWLGSTPSGIATIIVRDNQLFAGGYAIRQIDLTSGRTIDLTSGRTVQTIDIGISVWAMLLDENHLYAATEGFGGKLEKFTISPWGFQLSFVGHTNTVTAILLLNERIYSCDKVGDIFAWNKETGERIMQFYGFQNIPRLLYRGEKTTGSDDGKIRVYDSTSGDTLPVFTAEEHKSFTSFLHVHENLLFSGRSDSLIMQWSLANFTYLKTLYGHLGPVSGIDSDSTFLYSGGYDMVVRKWDISSGSQIAVSSRHNDFISAIDVTEELGFSGSEDSILKIWNKNSIFQLRSIDTFYSIKVILAFGAYVSIGTSGGVKLVDISSGQQIVYIRDFSGCTSLALVGTFLITGHGDGAINSRDTITLSVLGVFSGHKSIITSLRFDDSNVLVSSSIDGIIKKWDMRTRKVAFSFENRNGSVTSLTAIGNKLIVGTFMGRINIFSIDSAELDHFHDYHQKEVSILVVKDQVVYSSAMDGM